MQAVRAGKGETGSRNEKKAKERLFTALSIMAIQLRGAGCSSNWGLWGSPPPPTVAGLVKVSSSAWGARDGQEAKGQEDSPLSGESQHGTQCQDPEIIT